MSDTDSDPCTQMYDDMARSSIEKMKIRLATLEETRLATLEEKVEGLLRVYKTNITAMEDLFRSELGKVEVRLNIAVEEIERQRDQAIKNIKHVVSTHRKSLES